MYALKFYKDYPKYSIFYEKSFHIPAWILALKIKKCYNIKKCEVSV